MRPVLVLLLPLLIFAGCATPPTNTEDICSIFEQKDGLFNNWYRAAKATERQYGVPVPVLMATIYRESSFRAYARPKRTKLFGFIPWTRPSSAYGFSQALDGTWDQYRQQTGNYSAARNHFDDAVNFVGWYHYQSHFQNGIALNDAYNLYLAYYFGHSGYNRGDWQNNSAIKGAAARSRAMANKYALQMRNCGL